MAAMFHEECMFKEQYKVWLEPVNTNKSRAEYTKCMKKFSFYNKGKTAVRSHALG